MKAFTFRTSFGVDMNYQKNRNFAPVYFVSPQQQNEINDLFVGNSPLACVFCCYVDTCHFAGDSPMDLVMRTQYLTLFLCAILSVASSVVAAVFTTQSLDQYAQTLFSDSRYALLAPHRVGEPSDGSLEGLERVRTQVGDTMILFTKDTVKPATLASQFITADGILGWGVVLSSDGWVVSYIAEDENLVAWKDGVRFAVDRVVRDADTDMALFHLRDAQNMPVAAFAGTAVLQSGETLFAAQDAHTLSPVALADARYPLFPSSRLAHVISTQWLFAENLPLQSFLFSSSGALAGFSLDRNHQTK
jgi:hypothetical protein